MFLPFASSGLRARERTCVGLNCVVFVCALVFNLVVFNIPFTSFTCNVDCLAILGSKEIIAQNHFVFMHLLRWCYLSLNWKFAFADDVTPLSRQGGGGNPLCFMTCHWKRVSRAFKRMRWNIAVVQTCMSLEWKQFFKFHIPFRFSFLIASLGDFFSIDPKEFLAFLSTRVWINTLYRS